MRLILMGTGPFAVPSFEAIRVSKFSIVQVITRPIVSQPNKKETQSSPVREWAQLHSLPLADPASINEESTIQWLASLQADLMVVCDYGQILSRKALEATRLGGVNLHGSLLPRHRGAAPVQWTILSGDSEAGVSVIHMTPSLDGGPVLSQAKFHIEQNENAQQLETRLSEIGVKPTLESIDLLSHCGQISDALGLGAPQDKALATKAPRLSKNDGELDFRFMVRHLDRLVRGLQPWPGTYTHLLFPDGKTVRTLISHIVPIQSDHQMTNLSPGDLIFGQALASAKAMEPQLDPFELAVVAADGFVGIPMLQPAGKRMMKAADFLRGYAKMSHLRFTNGSIENELLKRISQIDS